ncbi:MAG: choice-of-anchor N protein [Immundisolibacteraceae bacterium]|nr:choice-of-anchor N protein [Immundisolibacteraceae bacterium]
MNIKQALSVAGLTLLSFQLMAVPRLQLDITSTSTYYDAADETIKTTDPQFTLNAFLNDSDAAGDFFIAVAVSPKQVENSSPDIGSFTVEGTSYSIGDMIWGTPPEGYEKLPKHGIYDTYFLELAVSFDISDTVALYNTEDGAGSPGTMMFDDFVFDVSGLNDGYQLHFDLYEVDTTTKKVVVDKAPFSHDAGTNVTVTVPEPGVIALLGIGLVSIGAARGRRKF